ncbi:MAG TPA: imidazole glycerol phosphate synthase subunit HisH [bacterium]|nr:imidazole glycerol phosphate synthase subunit HisH [bacterium]
MIAVVDYGVGNLHSVAKALEKVGAKTRVTTDWQDVGKAEGVVLPGVGAFKDSMDGLHRSDLGKAVRGFIATGKPFLGVCVGLQMLFSVGEEFGLTQGLGVFPGRVVKFTAAPKVPHMGWNQIAIQKKDNPLLKGVKDGDYVYFVHSYYVQPENDSIVATKTSYGQDFTSMVWEKNVFGTQFHPEKSQTVGLKIYENFKDLAGTKF